MPPKCLKRSVRSILCKSNKPAKPITENSSICNAIENLSAPHAQYPDDDLPSTVTRDYSCRAR